MYFMYVDESGDPGMLPGSPTTYHVLAGLIVHESQWRNLLDDLMRFRRRLQHTHGLSAREEVHAVELMQSHRSPWTIPRHIRLDILKKTIDFCASQNCIRIIGVVLDKRQNGNDVYLRSWSTLIQCYENVLMSRGLPCTRNHFDHGMMICDNTDVRELTSLLRKHRASGVRPLEDSKVDDPPILGVRAIVEDPVTRDSAESYFVQTVDVIAYFLHQLHQPNEFVRRKHAAGFFNRLKDVVVIDEASGHPFVLI